MDANTPIWQLTVGQFTDLLKSNIPKPEIVVESPKQIARSIKELADFFGCSKTKAQEIKSSGIIDAAVTQTGRTFLIDLQKAEELVRKHWESKK